MHKYSLPTRKFFRLPDILAILPISKSLWWKKVKSGEFPQPIKLSKNITVWRAEDIHALIDSISKKSVEKNSTSVLKIAGGSHE